MCICTFRRPDLLARLLEGISNQVRASSFSFDLVVVDNDSARSAEQTVRRFQQRMLVETTYECEPEQNISLARNRAVRMGTGNLVAFIDDDECPVREWLVRLYQTLKDHSAHGVLGPVLPELPTGAPAWLRRGRFFERRRLPTGSVIGPKDARTGNLLLLRSLFDDDDGWFDPVFGRTGGEDSDFFRRQFARGRIFVWSDDAVAHEIVPPERWTASYHIKRYLRSGTVDGELVRAGRYPGKRVVIKNVAIMTACLATSPLLIVVRKHLRVRVIQKMAYCGGIIAASWGLSLLRYRD